MREGERGTAPITGNSIIIFTYFIGVHGREGGGRARERE